MISSDCSSAGGSVVDVVVVVRRRRVVCFVDLGVVVVIGVVVRSGLGVVVRGGFVIRSVVVRGGLVVRSVVVRVGRAVVVGLRVVDGRITSASSSVPGVDGGLSHSGCLNKNQC